MLETTRPIRDYVCDDHSDVSSLESGSIRPNVDYDPARDPRHLTFIPPLSIMVTVKGKVEVPEWLRMERYDSLRRPAYDVNEQVKDGGDLRRQDSWDSRRSTRQDHIKILPCHSFPHGDDLKNRWKEDSPDCLRGAKSTTTRRTSPTSVSDDEDAPVWPEVAIQNRWKHRFSFFPKRRLKITLWAPRGRLT